MSDSFATPMDVAPPGSSVHGIFPGKNGGMGCHFLLQEVFPTQGSNPHLLYWQVDSLPLSHHLPKFLQSRFSFNTFFLDEDMDTRVGSLALLQGIFLTQESNWGLLHCQ